jgi:hypothetical protein
MDEDDMASALAFELNKDCWKAEATGNLIKFTNEDGETFTLTVEKDEPETQTDN